MSEAARVDQRGLEHLAFSVFEPAVLERLRACSHFPEPRELRALGRGIPSVMEPWFEFTEQNEARLKAAGGFDALIAVSAQIPTRRELHHDLLGALIWLHFPALKTAIHRLQLGGGSGPRSALQNAATHLDESGVLVVSSDLSVFQGLAELRFREELWEKRAALLTSTRFIAFGHGLLDALRAPHPRLMGKALFVHVTPTELALDAAQLRMYLDGQLAAELGEFLCEPARLLPLPVLGIPGWSPAQSQAFYGDECYFRRARRRPRATVSKLWLGLGPCRAALAHQGSSPNNSVPGAR